MPELRGRALTQAEVRTAAERGLGEIVVPPELLVTPLARDVARELGVVIRTAAGSGRAPDPAGDDLESRVRRIVTGIVSGGAGANGGSPASSASSVRHVDARSVQLGPFPYEGPEPGQDVRAADVVTAADGSPMAAGFLTLTRGCFPWTLTYDEIQYVVEGELHIGLPTGTVVGRPGDVLYVPRGSAITFGTPSWAKFFYVTFPADWEASLS